MYARLLSENLMCVFFLAINKKSFCQTLSSVDNSIIVLLFGCLVLSKYFKCRWMAHQFYFFFKTLITLTVCSHHVTYEFLSESALYSSLNVKKILGGNRSDI